MLLNVFQLLSEQPLLLLQYLLLRTQIIYMAIAFKESLFLLIITFRSFAVLLRMGAMRAHLFRFMAWVTNGTLA